MAVTWVHPIHTNKGKTIAQTIKERSAYAENPDKTLSGEFVSSFMCDARTADAEWLLSKEQYERKTGRRQGKNNILAYHVLQSFKPGEITPETANELGRELVERYTNGEHAFVVGTHIDKEHVHNHIVFNSTTLDCGHKFVNEWNSAAIVQNLSDDICREHGLSVIEKSEYDREANRGKNTYAAWLEGKGGKGGNALAGGTVGGAIVGGEPANGEAEPTTWQGKLKLTISDILSANPPPKDFNEFLSALSERGYEIKRGKNIAVKAPGQKKFTRLNTLRGEFTQDAIAARIAGVDTPRLVSLVKQDAAPAAENRGNQAAPNLIRLEPNSISEHDFKKMIDLSSNEKAQANKGYERWATIFNLKNAAQTLMFLQEHGIKDYGELEQRVEDAQKDFRALEQTIKDKDKRLRDIAALQKQIGNYSRTSNVYAEYKKSGYSKKFKAEHVKELETRKAAQNYFDGLGLEKLPTIKTLQTEYATVKADKNNDYKRYSELREEIKTLSAAKANADKMMGGGENQKAEAL